MLNDPSSEEYFLPHYHNTDFFEIIFFKKGSGKLFLNDKVINVQDNKMVFISPFQKKKWSVDASKLDFTLLVFQEDFLNEFFADKLFTYRLSYFYQIQYPVYLNSSREQILSFCNILQEIKAELISANLNNAHIIRSLIYYLL